MCVKSLNFSKWSNAYISVVIDCFLICNLTKNKYITITESGCKTLNSWSRVNKKKMSDHWHPGKLYTYLNKCKMSEFFSNLILNLFKMEDTLSWSDLLNCYF
jgi:hypothetical protein